MNATEKKLYAEAVEVAKEAHRDFKKHLNHSFGIEDREMCEAYDRMYLKPAAITLCAQIDLISRVFDVSEEEVRNTVFL